MLNQELRQLRPIALQGNLFYFPISRYTASRTQSKHLRVKVTYSLYFRLN